MSALRQPEVVRVLDRLHTAARGDWKQLVSVAPVAAWGWLTGRSLMQSLTPGHLRSAYLPVSREEGELLYVLARSASARRIVEFGCSFGISTLYLAAAARDSGGTLVTTEIEPTKVQATRQHLREAGLDRVATVLEGDALLTLREVEGPIDFVFLDGWKDLYLPVLQCLQPKLRQGAVVVGDNVDLADARPYVSHLQRPEAGFASCSVLGGRTLISCFTGG